MSQLGDQLRKDGQDDAEPDRVDQDRQQDEGERVAGYRRHGSRYHSSMRTTTAVIGLWLGGVSTAAAQASERVAAPVQVTGVVFVDRNGNGTRDTGEPGVAGVSVSDQVSVTATDADGRFTLAANGYGYVFVEPARWLRGPRDHTGGAPRPVATWPFRSSRPRRPRHSPSCTRPTPTSASGTSNGPGDCAPWSIRSSRRS